jgi:predicted ATPase
MMIGEELCHRLLGEQYQFVIATHSPFLLSMRGAKIYDLDEEIVDVKPWTELKNVRMYFDFFEEHRSEFR